jgi:nitrite reductase/ring-hydroxylating ferredoxin subunit
MSWEAAMAINRRAFIKLTGATALCACVDAMGLTGCSDTARACTIPLAPEGSYRRDGDRVILSLKKAAPLTPVGGVVRCALEGDEEESAQLVVAHSAPETYQAFSNRCTHNGKALTYLPKDHKLQCRSRKAQFDLEGNVLRGPAKRALLAYPTRREGDQLVIAVS